MNKPQLRILKDGEEPDTSQKALEYLRISMISCISTLLTLYIFFKVPLKALLITLAVELVLTLIMIVSIKIRIVKEEDEKI